MRVKLPTIRSRLEQAFTDLETYGTSDNDAHLKLIHELQEEALHQPADEQITATETAPVAPAAPAAPAAAASPAPETNANIAAGDTGEDDTGDTDTDLPPEVRAAAEQLKSIAFGTWFHIQQSTDEHPIRVKLSWYSRMSGNYMFVDSMGVKSTVWPVNELAAMMVDGRARVISDSKKPFVRRALVAIRKILTGD